MHANIYKLCLLHLHVQNSLINLRNIIIIQHGLCQLLVPVVKLEALFTMFILLLTEFHTTRLTAPLIPSTGPLPCDVAKTFQVISMPCFSCRGFRAATMNRFLNLEVKSRLSSQFLALFNLEKNPLVFQGW